MNINVRKEQSTDHLAVFNLIEKAFANETYSDHKEQFLVNRLRESTAYIPELSIIAESDNQVIGHILLTKINIVNNHQSNLSLALAPISVLPNFQKQGIGTKLMNYAHKKAKELGFTSVILLGHPDYYTKFGYRPTENFGINLPFDAPKEYCMAKELTKESLKNTQGTVLYPKEFYE